MPYFAQPRVRVFHLQLNAIVHILVDTTNLSANWVKPLIFFSVWPTVCLPAILNANLIPFVKNPGPEARALVYPLKGRASRKRSHLAWPDSGDQTEG
jgi:hypothetical protein